MRYPQMISKPRELQVQDTFAGYNHNARIGPSEFYDMKNLTGDLIPVMSPRRPRAVVATGGNYQGLACKDGLCYVDGPDLFLNGHRLNIGLSDEPSMCPKQLVSMGAYLVIFPDGKYVNTVDPTDAGSINAEFQTVASVTLTPCRLDGTEMIPEYVQPSAPEDPKDKALWIDTSKEPHVIQEYSQATGLWVLIITPYIRIESAGIGANFEVEDGVELSGFAEASKVSMGEDLQKQVGSLDGTNIIIKAEKDWIIVTGLIDSRETMAGPVKVSRMAPLMDYVVEHDNRLYGCRYGLDRAGSVVNELYVCKLGDFKNWSCYQGITTDSYRVSLGSDGPFTGATTIGGHPTFFKEKCLHKFWGNFPSNFKANPMPCRGVQKGSDRSLAIVNEVLYYKSQNGICAYDGSLPTEISPQFGNMVYKDAVGAAIGNKYYCSMIDYKGQPVLFVYDTARGIWHKEDSIRAYLMCPCRDELFCVDTEGRLMAMLGTTGELEPDPVPWMAETGVIGATEPGNKYLCKLGIRMVLEPGSRAEAYVQYDSTGPWDCIGTAEGMDLRSFIMPMIPQRCDHLRIRLTGQGPAKIFAITKEMSRGSDA